MGSELEDVRDAAPGGDRGFSLVELLIVIVLLGVLSSVTVFAVRGITSQGTTSACGAEKQTLESAIGMYYARYGGSLLPVFDSTDADTVATVEEALVDVGVLRSTSSRFNVNRSGVITAVASSGCTA